MAWTESASTIPARVRYFFITVTLPRFDFRFRLSSLRFLNELSDVGAQLRQRFLVNVHHVSRFVVTGGKVLEQNRIKTNVVQGVVNPEIRCSYVVVTNS